MKKAMTTLGIIALAGFCAGCAHDTSQRVAATGEHDHEHGVALGAASDPGAAMQDHPEGPQQDPDHPNADRPGQQGRQGQGEQQRQPSAQEQQVRQQIQQLISTWPETSQQAANAMLQKYGIPQGVTRDMLVWRENGPWLATVVFSEPIQHNFPMEHEDVLEQFINYKVPPDKFDDLAQYDGSVMCERTAGWMSARCDKEEANFLAINLAHRIVTGELSVEQARSEYAETIAGLMQGKSSDLTQGFIFEPATGGTGDPDKPVDMPQRESR